MGLNIEVNDRIFKKIHIFLARNRLFSPRRCKQAYQNQRLADNHILYIYPYANLLQNTRLALI